MLEAVAAARAVESDFSWRSTPVQFLRGGTQHVAARKEVAAQVAFVSREANCQEQISSGKQAG